jgi:hypothetical protein
MATSSASFSQRPGCYALAEETNRDPEALLTAEARKLLFGQQC